MNDYDKGYRDGVNREIQHTKYYKEQSELWHKSYDKLINSLSTPQMNEAIANLSGEGTEQTRLEIEVQKLNNENNTLKQCFLSIFEENEKLKKYFSMLFEELEHLTDKSGCDVCFEWEHKDEVLKLIKGE